MQTSLPHLVAFLCLNVCAAAACSDGVATVYSDALDLSPVAVASPESPLPPDWYQRAVFMEIYIRGYQDSDGDGFGDFRGLTSRLDYLADLGIGGIWLMPMTESWDNDHGYAVADYRAVESNYGTREDFLAFLDAAHERGIGVIVDYVMNHSARQNPLFQDSYRSVGDKRDWYVWRPNNPGWRNWGGTPSWHSGLSGYHYYGVFWEEMPDFNLRNEEVLRFHEDNLRYWLNAGVDGFRFDAVGTFVENGPDAWESQEENHVILGRMREVIHAYDSRFLICEEPAQPQRAAQRDSCGGAFAFGLNYDLVGSAREGALRPEVARYLNEAPIEQMGIILANHDSFAGDRLIAQFDGDEARYKLAAATQLLLPGIPFVYYGEEIGLGRSRGQSGDWAIRAPMSWTGDDDNAGFTTGRPFRALADNVRTHNVAAQESDPSSLLRFYRDMIALRTARGSLSLGDFRAIVSTGGSEGQVFAFVRTYGTELSLVIVNYGDEAAIELDLGGEPASFSRVYPADGAVLEVDSSGRAALTAGTQSVAVYAGTAAAAGARP